MMTDLIADALTRIRNASMRKLEAATLVHSNTVEAVCNVLKEKEYIEDYKVVDTDPKKKTINVTLKYNDNGKSVINELKSFKNGYGTIIVSTNKGVIANDEAYKQNVGGEVLCSVW
jgi:small subunit ribosomal protein S8